MISIQQKPVCSAARREQLAALRQLIVDTERRGMHHHAGVRARTDCRGRSVEERPARSSTCWCTGIDAIDDALPTEGLGRSMVHEVTGCSYADTSIASGFILSLIRRLASVSSPSGGGTVLWCQGGRTRHEFGRLYGGGLKEFGLEYHQFLFVEANSNRDILWALEEGARSSGLLAVVGEVHGASFTETRRLALAAEAGKTPVLLRRPHDDRGGSAADTRWHVAASPGAPDPHVETLPGLSRWEVELSRCRGGRPGVWRVEWNDEAYHFNLVEKFSAGPPQSAGASFGAAQFAGTQSAGPRSIDPRSIGRSITGKLFAGVPEDCGTVRVLTPRRKSA